MVGTVWSLQQYSRLHDVPSRVESKCKTQNSDPFCKLTYVVMNTNWGITLGNEDEWSVKNGINEMNRELKLCQQQRTGRLT